MGADILARLFSRPHPVAAPVAPPSDANPSAAALVPVLRAVGMKEPEFWAHALFEPCERFAIRPGRRFAAFAATIAHESADGLILVENLNYSVAGLQATWPSRFPAELAQRIGRSPGKAADVQAIANYAYGNRMGNGGPASGDGWKYRGRGLVQITGRDAYRQAGRALGIPLEDEPDLATRVDHAAAIAAWVWGPWKGCNEPADLGDISEWRRRINGGANGIEDVRRRYERALAVS